ncbi:MAG: hypothetical protein IPG34_19530 [Rhodocyclaceae bacterium]|nr:hypothetical protein [Rhodocyclaceae bacterium]
MIENVKASLGGDKAKDLGAALGDFFKVAAGGKGETVDIGKIMGLGPEATAA